MITVDVDLISNMITWYKNENKLESTNISARLIQKGLYPAVVMNNKGESLQFIKWSEIRKLINIIANLSSIIIK